MPLLDVEPKFALKPRLWMSELIYDKATKKVPGVRCTHEASDHRDRALARGAAGPRRRRCARPSGRKSGTLDSFRSSPSMKRANP